jgi:hypothetical protein
MPPSHSSSEKVTTAEAAESTNQSIFIAAKFHSFLAAEKLIFGQFGPVYDYSLRMFSDSKAIPCTLNSPHGQVAGKISLEASVREKRSR